MDKFLYVFGSFSRKKGKRKSVVEQSSISAGNSPLRLPRPITSSRRTSAYRNGVNVVKEGECGICKKELKEPRLLGCLHSFCHSCLEGLLHQEWEVEVCSEVDGSFQIDPGESGSGSANSAGSGYESDLRHSGSEGSWEQKHKYGIFTRKISGKSVHFLVCPTCGHETPLPLGGISALPLNYVLLRKIVANKEESVLCDLCNCDNKAESRCTQCLVSVCSSCGEAHGRQKATSGHSLKRMDTLPLKYCSQHPTTELTVYCATCQQVVCRDCCLVCHSGHALANTSRAAAERAVKLRAVWEQAKHGLEELDRAAKGLREQALENESRVACVESEVQTWAEQYRRTLEAHIRGLFAALNNVRKRYQQQVEDQNKELEERAHLAREAVGFAEELLKEDQEDELLSLTGTVIQRLERLSEPLSPAPRSELRFAPAAPAFRGDCLLAGRVFTTVNAPHPESCVLYVEGLQDLWVDCPHVAIFELRDSNGERIWCGGEQVAGYFRRRDSSAPPALAKVTDRNDGTYSVAVTPPSPGTYLLGVTLNNEPVKGSPFPCAARLAHTGQFHCCAFCSSGGRSDAVCGCGYSIGGGYKGCGHGHAGWPGAHHWSCCGAFKRNSACTRLKPRPRPRSQLYQFSL